MSAELSQTPSTPGGGPLPLLSAADVDSAAKRIGGVVTPTPLQFSDRLSATTAASVYLKREDLQTVRSYKLRGAYNLLVQLSDAEIAAGVVCSSAGNHAQGFAYACRTLGIHGRVYVPAKTPKQKRDRIRYHGGEFIELIVGGSTYDLAAEAALADVARTGATLVPPFDDPRTIAGQGTIAVELLGQLDDEPDLVVVPVGGGGCIAGITTYLAERTTNTSVLGIEPAGAAAMRRRATPRRGRSDQESRLVKRSSTANWLCSTPMAAPRSSACSSASTCPVNPTCVASPPSTR